MAQLMVSWFIYEGAIRVHAINAVGRRKGRIIEVEVVDTGERFHGSARRLDRLVRTLRRSEGATDHVPVPSSRRVIRPRLRWPRLREAASHVLWSASVARDIRAAVVQSVTQSYHPQDVFARLAS